MHRYHSSQTTRSRSHNTTATRSFRTNLSKTHKNLIYQRTMEKKLKKNPENKQQQQHKRSSNNPWSLKTDIMVDRTEAHLNLLEETHNSQPRESSTGNNNVRLDTPCQNCLLRYEFCACPEFPNPQRLTSNLSQLVDCIVYYHSNEVFGLTSSNTARFLTKHGAYPVLMGDYFGEATMRNIILSRPRDSVFVLFPATNAITPEVFMQKFSALQSPDDITVVSPSQNNINPTSHFAIYPPPGDSENATTTTDDRKFGHSLADLTTPRLQTLFPGLFPADGLKSCNDVNQGQSDDSTQTVPDKSLKPLVIILDGTWSSARSLDRRLNLILSEVFRDNLHQECEKLGVRRMTQQDDADTDDGRQTTLEPKLIDPKDYLYRVGLTRAVRSDIGQLRRIQSSERNVIATITSENLDDQSIIDQSGRTQSTKHPHKKPTVLNKEETLEDNSGGKVSTLHAVLVMIEEMFNLPPIQSHQNMSFAQYQPLLQNVKQETALQVVIDFVQLLRATVIGYHSQRGLQKAQLLDSSTRQLVKEKYDAHIQEKQRQKNAKLQAKIQRFEQEKDHQLSTPSSPQHIAKKQRLDENVSGAVVSIDEKID